MRDHGAIDTNVGGGEHFVGAIAYDNLVESSGARGDMDVAAPVGSILSVRIALRRSIKGVRVI